MNVGQPQLKRVAILDRVRLNLWCGSTFHRVEPPRIPQTTGTTSLEARVVPLLRNLMDADESTEPHELQEALSAGDAADDRLYAL